MSIFILLFIKYYKYKFKKFKYSDFVLLYFTIVNYY